MDYNLCTGDQTAGTVRGIGWGGVALCCWAARLDEGVGGL